MNRKSKIIVSVVGIAIVTLALLGLTYAYYLTRIQGNTNTNSISVTTADLKLVYGDGNGLVTANDIMPGTVITKTFTVTNDGESKVENYVVVLESIVNTLTRIQDLKYTLTCKFNNGDSCGETEELVFPSGVTEKAIFLNSIDKDITHYYTLVVTYENLTNTDQSDDMGSSISALVNIKDKSQIDTTGLRNPSYTIGETILASYGGEANITELTSNDFKVATTENDASLYKAEDDYGTSYYFRGNVTNNYVKFAGYEAYDYWFNWDNEKNYSTLEACEDNLSDPVAFSCEKRTFPGADSLYWRIIRINGNGTIRMIYAGTSKAENGEVVETGVPVDNYNLFSYNGYMYGTEDDPYGDNSSTNLTDSSAKTALDTWYEQHLKANYEKYISDTLFCNDREEYSNSDGEIRYNAYKRFSDGTPTLTCSNKRDRFTVDDTNIGNGKLSNPVALITADEVVYSGHAVNKLTEKNYLSNSSKFMTLTPYGLMWGTAYAVYHVSDNYLYSDLDYSTYTGYEVRPVINLKADVPFTIDEYGTYIITTS